MNFFLKHIRLTLIEALPEYRVSLSQSITIFIASFCCLCAFTRLQYPTEQPCASLQLLIAACSIACEPTMQPCIQAFNFQGSSYSCEYQELTNGLTSTFCELPSIWVLLLCTCQKPWGSLLGGRLRNDCAVMGAVVQQGFLWCLGRCVLGKRFSTPFCTEAFSGPQEEGALSACHFWGLLLQETGMEHNIYSSACASHLLSHSCTSCKVT